MALVRCCRSEAARLAKLVLLVRKAIGMPKAGKAGFKSQEMRGNSMAEWGRRAYHDHEDWNGATVGSIWEISVQSFYLKFRPCYLDSRLAATLFRILFVQ